MSERMWQQRPDGSWHCVYVPMTDFCVPMPHEMGTGRRRRRCLLLTEVQRRQICRLAERVHV